jgi:glutamate 5-kinase
MFGDNDTLSAVLTSVVGADLLVLLTDIDGLYTDDPRKNPKAKLISEVPLIDEKIEGMAKGAVTEVGTGGMATKIAAATYRNRCRSCYVIVNSNDLNNVNRVIAGEDIGTLFLAHKRTDFNFKTYLVERQF